MHASEGQYSPEWEKLQKIERFGLEAITGRRQFLHRELREMMVTENIITAYQTRKNSKNWAEWANKNEKLAALLSEIEIMLNRE